MIRRSLISWAIGGFLGFSGRPPAWVIGNRPIQFTSGSFTFISDGRMTTFRGTFTFTQDAGVEFYEGPQIPRSRIGREIERQHLIPLPPKGWIRNQASIFLRPRDGMNIRFVSITIVDELEQP